MFAEQVALLQESLQEHANPQTKIQTKMWWESYVKESNLSWGVKMPVVRFVVYRWHKEHVEGTLDLLQQVDLA